MKKSWIWKQTARVGFFINVATSMLVAVSIAGCGTVKLHSDTREAQGKAAAKAWSEVKLEGFFDAERENQAKLETEEIESSYRNFLAQRENEIHLLAELTLPALHARFEDKLRTLVGSATPVDELVEFGKAANAFETETKFRQEILFQNSLLQSRNITAPDCKIVLDEKDLEKWKKSTKNSDRGAGLVESLKDLCGKERRAQVAFNTAEKIFTSGEIAASRDAWLEAQGDLTKSEEAVTEQRTTYEKALQDFSDAVERAKPGKSITAEVKDKAEKAASALNALEKIGGALGVELASKERIDRLNDLLASLQAGTELDTETASKAELIISMLPKLGEGITSIRNAGKGKDRVPLLIQRDIEQANLNAAAVHVAIDRKRVAMRKEIFHARLIQARSAARSLDWLRRADTNACSEDDMFEQVDACKKADRSGKLRQFMGKLPGRVQMTMAAATTEYLSANYRFEADTRALVIQDIALDYERNLQLSEVNAGMWASLIGATVDQAAQYAALGLKAEHFEKILNVLGIFYIGHGVNK